MEWKAGNLQRCDLSWDSSGKTVSCCCNWVHGCGQMQGSSVHKSAPHQLNSSSESQRIPEAFFPPKVQRMPGIGIAAPLAFFWLAVPPMGKAMWDMGGWLWHLGRPWVGQSQIWVMKASTEFPVQEGQLLNSKAVITSATLLPCSHEGPCKQLWCAAAHMPLPSPLAHAHCRLSLEGYSFPFSQYLWMFTVTQHSSWSAVQDVQCLWEVLELLPAVCCAPSPAPRAGSPSGCLLQLGLPGCSQEQGTNIRVVAIGFHLPLSLWTFCPHMTPCNHAKMAPKF